MTQRVRAAVILAVSTTIASLTPLPPAAARTPRRLLAPATMARSVTEAPGVGVTHTTLSFAPTHIAFTWTGEHGGAVRYRTLDREGHAGRWRTATEAHDLERGKTHHSAIISVARPHALQWSAAGPRDAGMGPITLDYLNTLDGERSVEVEPRSARKGARRPRIVTRAEWGADESIKRAKGDCRRRFFKVRQLFVHHTAGTNFERHPRATMRAIYWYHTVRLGWCDIGYNYVIGWDGTVYEGRWARRYRPWETHSSEDVLNRAVRGAHVAEFNSGSVGVSLMGNFSRAPLPVAMRRSLVRLLAWEADRHNLPPRRRHLYRNPETGLTRRLPFIAGHRDAGQTACPGGNVYKRLPRLRRRVARAIGRGKSNTALTVTASLARVPYGESARLTGRLTLRGGGALGGREVVLYRHPALGRWSRRATVVTRRDGSFGLPLAPEVNTSFVAVFGGGPRTWGSQTRKLRIEVSPDVGLAPQGARRDSDGIYRYPEGTDDLFLAGRVRPPHPLRRVLVRVFEVLPGGWEPLREAPAALSREGAYRYHLSGVSGGKTYRAVATLRRHRDHAGGRSPAALFEIEP